MSRSPGRGSRGGPRTVRGLGHGRKTRRTLSKGGEGVAGLLNETLGRWDGVKISPMFGRWGYFIDQRLFACFPLAVRERDLWIRLSMADQRRALAEGRARPHRRFASQGWVEMDVHGPADVSQALRWLRRAWSVATATRESEPPRD